MREHLWRRWARRVRGLPHPDGAGGKRDQLLWHPTLHTAHQPWLPTLPNLKRCLQSQRSPVPNDTACWGYITAPKPRGASESPGHHQKRCCGLLPDWSLSRDGRKGRKASVCGFTAQVTVMHSKVRNPTALSKGKEQLGTSYKTWTSAKQTKYKKSTSFYDVWGVLR